MAKKGTKKTKAKTTKGKTRKGAKVTSRKVKKRYAMCGFCETISEFRKNPELCLDPGHYRCETCGSICTMEPIWLKGG